jgi:hypothetical protein
MDRVVRAEFHCPKCGGYRWGTSGCTGPKVDQRGHCSDLGCRFSWPRAEDWRYFQFTIRPTRAQFRTLEAQRLREANRSARRSTHTKGQAK